VGDIIGAEQDADIAVKLGLLTLASTSRCPVLPVHGQVPPQLLSQAFFRVDVAVDRFLADALLSPIKDHPIANLFRRPSVLEMVHNQLTQFRIPDQRALR
jgi:hypothetical protein